MTQLLNDYLKRKQIIDYIIPGSQWKEMQFNKGIYTIIRFENHLVYYRYSENYPDYEWPCDLNRFYNYIINHCEKIQ